MGLSEMSSRNCPKMSEISSLLASTVHWPHFNEIRKTNKNRSRFGTNMLCRFRTKLYHQRSVSRKKESVLLAFQQSNLMYHSCHCNSRYVGRTSQRLQDRIKQHIPKSIRSAPTCSQIRSQPKRHCKSLTQQVPSTQSLIIMRFYHRITSITQSHLRTKL